MDSLFLKKLLGSNCKPLRLLRKTINIFECQSLRKIFFDRFTPGGITASETVKPLGYKMELKTRIFRENSLVKVLVLQYTYSLGDRKMVSFTNISG